MSSWLRVSDGVGSLESCKTVNEAYAVRRTVPPLAEMEQGIDGLLAGMTVGEDPQGRLSELAKLGAGMRHSWRLRAGGWRALSRAVVEPVDDVIHLWRGLELARAAVRASGGADADLEVRSA